MVTVNGSRCAVAPCTVAQISAQAKASLLTRNSFATRDSLAIPWQ
jgi:hypothetical protein